MIPSLSSRSRPATSRRAAFRLSILIVLIAVLSRISWLAPRTTAFAPALTTTTASQHGHRHALLMLFFQNEADVVRKQWVEKSVAYYSKVMREERKRNIHGGQADASLSLLHDPPIVTAATDVLAPAISVPLSAADQRDYLTLAKKHYFALIKVKDGKHRHAESIYRRIIDELMDNNNNINNNAQHQDEECDHAKLAVTTLLLALHMQRSKDSVSVKQTRSVFLNFFRIVTMSPADHGPCACSAKVLQAYALFEMKQGNELKSYMIVLKAIELDPELRPVLKWKQFRNAHERFEQLMVHRRITTGRSMGR